MNSEKISSLRSKLAKNLEINRWVVDFLEALNNGTLRVAEYTEEGWQVHAWVKEAILRLFKETKVEELAWGGVSFYDKLPLRPKVIQEQDKVRIVPGGTTIRNGSYLAKGVIVMPPAYVNVGAYVGQDTLIDSHVLVGSCAQIGCNVHLSAGTQIGGVLEPVGNLPVIVEDEVFVGGNCGIYEGVIIKRGAVLGSGVILNNSIKVYDAVKDRWLVSGTYPLMIPEQAVVVPGSRPLAGKESIHISCPVIIKYKDEGTKRAVQLEEQLR